MRPETKVFPDTVDNFFFQKAWEILLENRAFFFKLILAASLIYTLIYEAFNAGIFSKLVLPPIDESLTTLKPFLVMMIFQVLAEIVKLLPETFILIMLVSALPLMYERYEVDAGSVMPVNLSRWMILYAYSVFVLILEVIGLTMCLVPGLIVMIQFALLPFIVVLEKDANIIPRSLSIVSGRQWNILLILLGFFAISLMLNYTISGFLTPDTAAEGEVKEYVFSMAGFLNMFIQQVIVVALRFYIIILFFQMYMLSRIERGEIEVVSDNNTSFEA